MADLVLGLAKSAVEGTLTAAKSAIEEEEKLKKGMQRDLMLISDEFEMMHAFLNITKDRATDEMVKTLVRQVRNMALDVEDCIEFVVLMDIKSHWWRRMLPFCMLSAAPADPLGDAVTAIELLKSRVEAMGQRNERYRHIGASSSNSTEKTNQQAVADATAVGILIEAREAKKQQSSPRDLIELINKIDVSPLQVISVWGAVGDLGVASIIKKTWEDPEICKKFRNCCLQQGSSGDLVTFADVMMATEGKGFTDEFVKQVSEQRYLVFLEDVSSTVDWEAVRVCLPGTNQGSCIVVHTQQLEVASLCVGQSHRVLELEQFSEDHSVCVFFNEATKKKRSSPKDLVHLIISKVDAENTPRRIISVCEQPGHLEVASIIKKGCDKYPEICEKFNYRASVKLIHPFKHEDFIRSLPDQLCTNYCAQHGSAEDFDKVKGVMMITEGELIEESVKQVMSNQRYLIFLEHLSSKDDLDAVMEFLPDMKNGSCIVVLTQQLEVAKSCVGQSVLELHQPTADLSVRIFYTEDEGKDEDEDADEDKRAIKIKDAKEWIDNHKDEIVGRKADIENLQANNSGIRPVFGMAGVGKSYIVKHVYFRKVIEGSFEKFGWVDVCHSFNIRDFSWRLLLDLHSGSLQHAGMLRIRDPIQVCRQLLKKHACLIVIDGLQSTEEWDSIKAALGFEPDQTRSRIIVIANEESVASYCSKNWWSVEGLEIDDALELFKRTINKRRWPADPSPADIETAKSVLYKCGGLPKVIIAVARPIANGWRPKENYFIQVLENHPAFGSLRGLFSWVDSFFRSCPDSLKPCIFYLSIFPVNHKIRRRRLVRRWIAEGYSRDTKDMTAEEKGEESFEKLCFRNMVQVPGSTSLSYMTRMPLWQVNGFLREYIVSRSMEENLVFELAGHCSVNSQRHTGRHLTIGSTWDRDKSVYESIDFSRLRSLTVFGKWETFFISDKMSILRVLDLEDASSVTDGDLEQMVMLLPRLKFLSLRGCREITRLPDSFGGLRQLQTLDIRHTSIVKLPLCITKIKKLQHIRAGTAVQLDDDTSIVESLPPSPEAGSATATLPSLSIPSMRRPPAATPVSRFCFPESWTRRWQLLPGSQNGGVEVPRGIGKMMMVHNISVIDVSGASGPAILEELKNLTQLRKLGVSGVKPENCKELCSAISGYAHLESLSLWLDKNQDGCLDSISPPPEELQSLELYGHVVKLPAWIKKLSNLRKLKLRLTMITQHDVDLLGDLPSLHTLCLCFKDFECGELRFRGNGCFGRLWVLEIACNSRLQSVTFADDEMLEQLEVLKIRCYNVPSSLKFYGLEKLQGLREILLSGLYHDKVKQRLEDQLKERPREMKPVLKEEAGSSRRALIS
ncbi:disease resistance protein RGA4 isoform X2 [Setaria viridis]|uniref:NB-ARC domain-containing protein n=1 Tax=Setaria viridis TaxID=4556 RepID=A0A4U6TH88_SETVI|nr:uncharacterized protein LOC117833484 isoform X2 [Setaria viridis]TKW01698.1 hypothetical protein SEVIR_8G196300v2 [Setaria viridis]